MSGQRYELVDGADYRVLRSALHATQFVLGERERELLELKGPCSNQACRLHYAHAGPCDVIDSGSRTGDPVRGLEPEPTVAAEYSCAERVWDGPYQMTCGHLIVNDQCVRHGADGLRQPVVRAKVDPAASSTHVDTDK